MFYIIGYSTASSFVRGNQLYDRSIYQIFSTINYLDLLVDTKYRTSKI